MTQLRGHGYYLELVGRRGGGPWLWLLFVAFIVAGLAVELAAKLRP